MLARGTTSLSKGEFAETVDSMGANYTGHSDREFTSFGMQVHKGDCGRAVSLLGDALCNPSLNAAEFGLLKDETTVEHDNSYQNYEGTTLESCHFNGYRDHMLGQPIKGDRDMTQEI